MLSRRSTGIVPVLLLLSGCGAADPDCNSADTRAAVIKTVAGDSNNALVDYAVKNSEALKKKLNAAGTEGDKSTIAANARKDAVYRLSEQIASSNSKDKRTATCSGTMFVTVEGDIVQKQVDFKVEQAPDEQHSVSVSPFQFDPNEGPH